MIIKIRAAHPGWHVDCGGGEREQYVPGSIDGVLTWARARIAATGETPRVRCKGTTRWVVDALPPSESSDPTCIRQAKEQSVPACQRSVFVFPEQDINATVWAVDGLKPGIVVDRLNLHQRLWLDSQRGHTIQGFSLEFQPKDWPAGCRVELVVFNPTEEPITMQPSLIGVEQIR